LHYFTYLHSWFENFRPVIQPMIPALAEATRVPGSGDPFAVLQTPEQQEALRQVLKQVTRETVFGWPVRWW